ATVRSGGLRDRAGSGPIGARVRSGRGRASLIRAGLSRAGLSRAHVTPPGTWHVPGGGLTDDHSTTIIRRRSAVAQLRALVEQLRAGADERGIGVAADRGQREGSHAVAVLEGQ